MNAGAVVVQSIDDDEIGLLATNLLVERFEPIGKRDDVLNIDWMTGGGEALATGRDVGAGAFQEFRLQRHFRGRRVDGLDSGDRVEVSVESALVL